MKRILKLDYFAWVHFFWTLLLLVGGYCLYHFYLIQKKHQVNNDLASQNA